MSQTYLLPDRKARVNSVTNLFQDRRVGTNRTLPISCCVNSSTVAGQRETVSNNQIDIPDHSCLHSRVKMAG